MIFLILMISCASKPINKEQRLLQAAQNRNFSLVKELIMQGANLGLLDGAKESILDLAGEDRDLLEIVIDAALEVAIKTLVRSQISASQTNKDILNHKYQTKQGDKSISDIAEEKNIDINKKRALKISDQL